MNKLHSVESHETLVTSARHLIHNIVNCNANADEIANIITTINTLNAQLHTLSKGRVLPHYDLDKATSDSNYALPYSAICGPLNPIAAPLLLRYNESTKEVHGTVNCNNVYEGPQHCVHGGIIASFYDQLLAMLSSCHGTPSVTAYLHIDYKKPTPLYQTLHFRAWIDNIEGRKIIIKGECTLNDERLTSAEGLFIQNQSVWL